MIRFLVTLLLILPLALLLLMLQLQPAVSGRTALDSQQITQIEQLIVDNQPARMEATGEQLLSLDSSELNLLVAWVSETLPAMRGWAGDFALEDERGHITLSIPWQSQDPLLYLNIEASVRQQEDGPELTYLRIGRLPLPARFARMLWNSGLQQWAAQDNNYGRVSDLFQSIEKVELRDSHLDILLQWEPQLLSRLRSRAQQLLIGEPDMERIQHHTEEIGRVVAELGPGQHTLPMNDLLRPLFAASLARSEAGADPVAEVRTLFQALALYLNKLILEDFEDEISPGPQQGSSQVRVVLQDRLDLARHFATSAAITSSAGAGIADILSASKEAYDARYRSGFSFSDMTANAAGRALAEAGTRDPGSALALQRRMADTSNSADYMPSVSRGEALSESDFAERYEDRDSPDYQRRLAEIEQVIRELAVYR